MLKLLTQLFGPKYAIIGLLLIATRGFAQFEPGGFKAYEQGDYEKSLEAFKNREIDDPKDLRNSYNRSVVQYRLKKFGEAQEGFSRSAKASDPELAERSLFNLANAQALAGDLENAMKSYEEVLRRNPNHREAQENLAAVKQWKEQPPEQNKSNDQSDNSQDEKQSQSSSSDNSQQGKNPQDHHDQPESNQSKEQGSKKPEQAGQQGGPQQSQSATGDGGDPEGAQMDKGQAEALLKGIEDNAKKFLFRNQDSKRQRSTPTTTDKDW